MRALLAAIYLTMLMFVGSSLRATADPFQDEVDQTFERAILKVDVSAIKAVFNDKGENICKSEGTAFVIGEHLAVTASHVYALDPECGEPIIRLKSKKYETEVFARIAGRVEDVTVLKFDEELPLSMCALPLRDNDVTLVDGMRFGIPGNMEYPAPMPVKIGPIESDFSPWIRLTLTPAENGESGGPVIYLFNVVGILRAKHVKYPAYSVMTPISKLINVITQNNIPVGVWRVCSPGALHMFAEIPTTVGPMMPQSQPEDFGLKPEKDVQAGPTANDIFGSNNDFVKGPGVNNDVLGGANGEWTSGGGLFDEPTPGPSTPSSKEADDTNAEASKSNVDALWTHYMQKRF